MKIRKKTLSLGLFFVLISEIILASDSFANSSNLGWIDSEDVCINQDGVFLDTNAGIIELTVIDYDEINARYLVKCIDFCSHYYPTPDESLR